VFWDFLKQEFSVAVHSKSEFLGSNSETRSKCSDATIELTKTNDVVVVVKTLRSSSEFDVLKEIGESVSVKEAGSDEPPNDAVLLNPEFLSTSEFSKENLISKTCELSGSVPASALMTTVGD
jgi:hypothetical protein